MYEQYSGTSSQSTYNTVMPDVCPFLDCGMKVDIIYPVSTSARRGSQSFQSSGTSALSNLIGEKFNLFSSIPEDPMEEVKDTCSAEDSSKKRTNTSTEELTSKKKKTSDKEGDSAMLKKLVKELKDDSNNQELSFPTQSPEDSYTHLYKEIVKAKTQNDSAKKGGLDTEGVVGRDLLEEENAREILDDCNLLGVLGDDDSVT
ncbi:13333_t:CDS:2, partial [Funneliformis geosporum]